MKRTCCMVGTFRDLSVSRWAFVLLASIACFWYPLHAIAQEQRATASAPDAAQLQEVVVTG